MRRAGLVFFCTEKCFDHAQRYVLTNRIERKNLAVHDPVVFRFRTLEPTDGMALHKLVRDCPPLDPNSSYCNLLQCSHFKSTSIAVTYRDELVGSVTAYLLPENPDTLFVWQVAVHSSVRGKGLAREMLRKLFERMAPQGVRFVETSITLDNKASQGLFAGFAAEHNAEMLRSVLFEQAAHFEGAHDTEYLFRIGPIETVAGSPSMD